MNGKIQLSGEIGSRNLTILFTQVPGKGKVSKTIERIWKQNPRYFTTNGFKDFVMKNNVINIENSEDWNKILELPK